VEGENKSAECLYNLRVSIAWELRIFTLIVFDYRRYFTYKAAMVEIPEHLSNLALFRKFFDHITMSWAVFSKRRHERLAQASRNEGAAEKVAENILDDFFTVALDWKLEDLNNQVHYADMVLTRNGIKRLVIEVKRPGSLTWDQRSLERALEQARRYADEQRVRSIAVSDGSLFYAADIINGGLHPRARLQLDSPIFSLNSWWISADGIYRSPELLPEPQSTPTTRETVPAAEQTTQSDQPIPVHPKYKIPAHCFAYVGNASDTKTWKLPCWLATGEVDTNRLPGAIRAVLSTYRGTHVVIPEAAVPDVLVRLGKAAVAARKLPGQEPNPLPSYQQLYDALYQLKRLSEVLTQSA
jgi:Type I restriction enzyme R protein N terminus (HSDR_N)